MPYATHCLIFGIAGILYGLGDLLVPGLVLSANGMEGGALAEALVRLSGALCLGFSLTAFLSRASTERVAQLAVLGGGVAYAIAATAVTVHIGLAGLAGPLMWSLLIITLPLGANATRLLLALRRPAPASARA